MALFVILKGHLPLTLGINYDFLDHPSEAQFLFAQGFFGWGGGKWKGWEECREWERGLVCKIKKNKFKLNEKKKLLMFISILPILLLSNLLSDQMLAAFISKVIFWAKLTFSLYLALLLSFGRMFDRDTF